MATSDAVAVAGTIIRSAKWNNIAHLLDGSATFGDFVALTQYTSATVPALKVKNLSASGTHLLVQNSAGTTMLGITDAGIAISSSGLAMSDGGGIASLINDKWDAGRRIRLTDTITGTDQDASFTMVVADQNVASAAGLNSTFSVQTQYGATATGASAGYAHVFSTYSDTSRTVYGGGAGWDQNSLVGLGWSKGGSNGRVRGLVAEANVSSLSPAAYAIGAEIYARNYTSTPAQVYTGAVGSDFLNQKTAALAVEGGGGLRNNTTGAGGTLPSTVVLNTALLTGVTSLVVVVGDTSSPAANTAALAAAAASFPVTTGTTPDPNPMYLTLDDGTKQEIVSASAISATSGTYPSVVTQTFTIARGQEGTTAATTTFPAATTTVSRALFTSVGIVMGLGATQDSFRRGILFPRSSIAPMGVAVDMRYLYIGGGQKPLVLPNTGWVYGSDAVGTSEVGLIRTNSANSMELMNSAGVLTSTLFTWNGSGAAGATMGLTVANADNTVAQASAARLRLSVGGATTIGDPFVSFYVTGTTEFTVGIDNSVTSPVADPFMICAGAAIGTTQAITVDTSGNVVIGSAALATNATDGFLHVPSGAGAPSGVPTAYTGRVPMYVDTTNNFLYFRIGGSWKKSTVYA